MQSSHRDITTMAYPRPTNCEPLASLPAPYLHSATEYTCLLWCKTHMIARVCRGSLITERMVRQWSDQRLWFPKGAWIWSLEAQFLLMTMVQMPSKTAMLEWGHWMSPFSWERGLKSKNFNAFFKCWLRYFCPRMCFGYDAEFRCVGIDGCGCCYDGLVWLLGDGMGAAVSVLVWTIVESFSGFDWQLGWETTAIHKIWVSTPYGKTQFRIDNRQNRVRRWYSDDSKKLILIKYVTLNYFQRLCRP